MKITRVEYILLTLCLLSIILFAGTVYYIVHLPASPRQELHEGVTPASTQKPEPTVRTTTPSMRLTPPSAHDGFALPTNFQASDLFDYFLWEHAPVKANFPHGFNFPSPGPQTFLGFSDYTTPFTSHWYIVAVYATTTDAQQDYQAITAEQSTWDFLTNRCILIGDKETETSINRYYTHLVEQGCN